MGEKKNGEWKEKGQRAKQTLVSKINFVEIQHKIKFLKNDCSSRILTMNNVKNLYIFIIKLLSSKFKEY